MHFEIRGLRLGGLLNLRDYHVPPPTNRCRLSPYRLADTFGGTWQAFNPSHGYGGCLCNLVVRARLHRLGQCAIWKSVGLGLEWLECTICSIQLE